MPELTQDQIALGIRARRAGWGWDDGDVWRPVWPDGRAGDRFVAGPTRPQDVSYGYAIPDPTHRGFVSSTLAQVRERTGAVPVLRSLWESGARVVWECRSEGDGRLLGEGPTQEEAAVAALEATR